jgi:hypothetical protein
MVVEATKPPTMITGGDGEDPITNKTIPQMTAMVRVENFLSIRSLKKVVAIAPPKNPIPVTIKKEMLSARLYP